MIVSNGYIFKDKIDFSKVTKGKNGDYLDVVLSTVKNPDNKWVVEIRQKNGMTLGIAHPGYQTEQMTSRIAGYCEINLTKLEWDHGIKVEGHVVVVFRDRPNAHGNTVLINADQKHKSLNHLKITLGSGKRTDL